MVIRLALFAVFGALGAVAVAVIAGACYCIGHYDGSCSTACACQAQYPGWDE